MQETKILTRKPCSACKGAGFTVSGASPLDGKQTTFIGSILDGKPVVSCKKCGRDPMSPGKGYHEKWVSVSALARMVKAEIRKKTKKSG